MFQSIKTDQEINRVAVLADQIWRDHYTPIIGADQVDYMLDQFQSFDPIKTQIKNGMSYYLAIVDGKDCGYCAVEPRNQTLFLSKIYVKKSKRGTGIGRKMFQFIENIAQDKGCQEIELTVNKYNQHTIEIYQKSGFIIVESVVFDIGNGFVMDDYRMAKRI